jgi:hypothetical protein
MGLKTSRGFSLAEVTASVGLAGLVALGAAVIVIQNTRIEAQSERLFWLSARRMEIQSIVKSEAGWSSMLSNNSGMSCFRSPLGCNSFRTPQSLIIPMNGANLNLSESGLGLTNRGDFCFTYSATSGQSNCPIGVRGAWQAVCDSVACLHAQPKISIDFEMNEQGTNPQLMRNQSMVIYRDRTMETLSEVCAAMGGVLIGQSCSMPSLTGSCNPTAGNFVLGFDGSGQVICGRPNPGSCASSDVATGFAANGGIQCAPACP